jgi:S1-C subfamily serine protease
MIYKVSTRVETVQDGKPFDDQFRDGAGNPANPAQCIFPIFQQNNLGLWKPLGTGFFISSNGFFATAKHVLTDDRGLLLPALVGIQIMPRGEIPRIRIRQIIKATLHETADLAVGFLAFHGQDNTAFYLTERLPTKGDTISTFTISRLGVVALEGRKFELQFAPELIYSELEEHWPIGRDRVFLPNNCFQSAMSCEGGNSGGPVFFGNGDVFAINSTGSQGEKPYSFHSSVTDLLDMNVLEVPLAVDGGRIRDRISIRELGQLGYVKIT